ncbi:hypothetical protein DXG01_008385 [Tephrocybe rancida]|nr:hypothetical protein DXG01_008385 [Tephrocybe rancida]
MLYDTTTTHGASRPLLAVRFGPNNALGTVHLSPENTVPMKQYLTKVTALGSTKHRKFIASDEQEYRWNWRVKDDQEWTVSRP